MQKWNLNKTKLHVDESIPTCLHLSKAKKKEKERRQHLVNVKEKWINIVTHNLLRVIGSFIPIGFALIYH